MSDPSTSLPDRMADLEARLAALRDRLATLEVDLTVERARLSHFTGEAAAQWEAFQSSTAAAWDAYIVAGEHFSEAQAALSTKSAASETTGKKHADAADALLNEAEPLVDLAEKIVATLRHQWDQQEPRVMDARAVARAGGAEEVVSYADLLLDLVGRDPFAMTEEDVATLETQAEEARLRSIKAQKDKEHLQVELEKVRFIDGDLDRILDETRSCLDYARSRIAGLREDDPVTPDEVQALHTRFREISDKIDQMPANPTVALAVEVTNELEQWRSTHDAIRARWDAALTEGCNAVQRRDQLRGTWKALRARASACGLAEDRDVGKLISSTRELLWTAPLDVDLAERTLTQLSTYISRRAQSA